MECKCLERSAPETNVTVVDEVKKKLQIHFYQHIVLWKVFSVVNNNFSLYMNMWKYIFCYDLCEIRLSSDLKRSNDEPDTTELAAKIEQQTC
jgi:hypothetical protein